MNKVKILNVLIVLVSLFAGFFLAEFSYRYFLFNRNTTFDRIRNPDLFADYFSEDDYWKLYYRFDGQFKPPETPHPDLGWVGDFARETFRHNQSDNIRNRRPVLLYGDSFAHCAKDTKCFQDILNHDQSFSRDHYLLNYGVGGYGVDQIYLLFQKSFHQYEDPFVLLSFMTLDLDRSILTVRVGQKPYFTVENDELLLMGTPINSSPDVFFDNNPPRIRSYLYRTILFSNLLPDQIGSFLKRENHFINKKIEVNEKIILEMITELRDNNLDFVFLIFHPHLPGVSTLDDETDWRDSFLRRVLQENQIPHIWSKDVVKNDKKDTNNSYGLYIDPDNGHPTTYFNRLIAEEIKRITIETPK